MILIILYAIQQKRLSAKTFKIIGKVISILAIHGMEVVASKLKEIYKFIKVFSLNYLKLGLTLKVISMQALT